MDYKSKIILISGPTASGKSKIAINLAKKINGEIVNADSMQVYKQIKILTARPSEKDQKKIKHHLFGIIDVRKRFSTGQWLKECIKIINLIRKKNKVPVIVGGTGLYFKALVDGLVKIPKFKTSEKNKILRLHNKLGQNQFYKRLLKLDPISKKFVNQNSSFENSFYIIDEKIFFDLAGFIKIRFEEMGIYNIEIMKTS